MTDIVAPPDPIIPPPYPALGSSNFNSEAFAYGSAMGPVSENIAATAENVFQNATAAHERAQAAASSASDAVDAAQDAADDASRLAVLDALWLGAAATDPTVGRNGAPLVAGNAYINTVSGVLRAYTGSAWVQGVSGSTGVASINGSSGALLWTTLSQYGITDGVAKTADLGNVDLNTALTSGFYSFATPTNGPSGVTASQLIVSCGGTTAMQIVIDKSSGVMYTRGVSGIGSTPVFTAWARQATHSDAPVALAGGAMDCAAGNYFTETVSANRTFAFINVPSGAYACVLEVMHTGGTMTMPDGTVWKGAAPTFATGKRHLIYFQRAQLGTAGWYASTLEGFAA